MLYNFFFFFATCFVLTYKLSKFPSLLLVVKFSGLFHVYAKILAGSPFVKFITFSPQKFTITYKQITYLASAPTYCTFRRFDYLMGRQNI